MYRCFHIFVCLKLYFTSPFFHLDPFHVVNSLFSHFSCYFLHPIFEVFLFFIFQFDMILTFFEVAFVNSPVQLFVSFKIKYVAYSSQGSHTGQLDLCN